jgi:tRNA (mo5U34)-methyltransferase
MDKLFKHREKKQAKGGAEDDSTDLKIWYENELPGKRAFDLAASATNSKVESIDADFMTADLQSVGTFDVTLFLGVLYHLKHPLLALERVASLTKQLAIIETEAIILPGYEQASLCEFYETNELNDDASNWWAPTMPALLGLCRAAGFSRAEAVNHPPAIGKRQRLSTALKGGKPMHYRAFVHAWK